MADRCHGGVKTVIHGQQIPRRLSGFETAVCPNKPVPGRSFCESCLAEALARITVKPGPEAGLRWPGVTTGVHVHQRGTYARLAPQ